MPTTDREPEDSPYFKTLLDELATLEERLDHGVSSTRAPRIRARQELFLVDGNQRPSPNAGEVLERLNSEQFSPALPTFALSARTDDLSIAGAGFLELKEVLTDRLSRVTEAASLVGARPALVGVLPTLRRENLGLDSMFPVPSHLSRNQVAVESHGDFFELMIKGVDELQFESDSIMHEACAASLVIQFPVDSAGFVSLYNASQLVAAPVLAVACNSPTLFGMRLWRDTRVALFGPIGKRGRRGPRRPARPRVVFGGNWLRGTVVELIREDISRARTCFETTSALGDIGHSLGFPALEVFCKRVPRWNGVLVTGTVEEPSLDLTCQCLPAGPTIMDEVANVAFWLGLVMGVRRQFGDVCKLLEFKDVHSNFLYAARYGLDAQLQWLRGKAISAADLIRDHLLSVAEEGLTSCDVSPEVAQDLLAIIEERVSTGRTGARWQLDSLSHMKEGGAEEHLTALTSTMCDHLGSGEPVHQWDLANLDEEFDWRSSYLQVGQLMSTDVFTVQPDDIVDLAASVMDWERLRHIPVEDADEALVGLITQKALLRLVARGLQGNRERPIAVKDIMSQDLVTVSPDTPTLDALALMRDRRVGCLPVVEDGRLVGLLTEDHVQEIASRALDYYFREELDQSQRVAEFSASDAVPRPRDEVFICYRGEDSAAITERIRDRMKRHFGVFLDTQIRRGVDFRDVLRSKLAICRVLLVIIGPKWNPHLESGGRRLESDSDFVRFEIRCALERGSDVLILPVLVDGAQMPLAEDLPKELRDLAFRTEFEVRRGRHFDKDLRDLIGTIHPFLSKPD